MYNFIKMAGTSREKQYHVAATGNNWLYLVWRVFGGISRLELSLSKRQLSKSVRKCFSKKNECEKYLTIFVFEFFNQRSKMLFRMHGTDQDETQFISTVSRIDLIKLTFFSSCFCLSTFSTREIARNY